MDVWDYPERVFMADIIGEVAHVFGVDREDLIGPRRFRPIARPRFVCAYLGRRLTPLSYPQIGATMGGRDHSTIIHAAGQAEYLIERDAEFRAYVDAIRIRLLSTRERAERRRREANAILRERVRRERVEADRLARREVEEAASIRRAAEMDDLSRAVAAYVKSGGSFVEVYS